MLGEKSLTGRSSLFLSEEVGTVLTTPSQLSASHFKRSWGSDKRWAVFRSIDDLPACFCMGRYLCLEPILPVATPVAALWRSTCKPYGKRFTSHPSYEFWSCLTLCTFAWKKRKGFYVSKCIKTNERLWKVTPRFLEFIVLVYKVVQNIANGRIRKFNVACNYGSETAGGICCGLPHASSSHYSTTQSDITVSKESQEERTMASMRR